MDSIFIFITCPFNFRPLSFAFQLIINLPSMPPHCLTKENSSRRKVEGNIVFRGLHKEVSEIAEDLREIWETFY